MTRTVKEPTLPLDHLLLERNVGFRAPIGVRVRFRLLSMVGGAQRFWYDTVSGEWHAFGWKKGGDYYVTEVHAGNGGWAHRLWLS